ncbi:scavenger receptor class B member 1 isoform 10 [Homo sapiens]|uniref:scavenger receptor class B member 1 isoform 10 n=1 Tax=Homo sapiens TaxID=9606 RepID=UPI000F8A2090|nr:scavenger receptor class B member 1 isoform 10 [Homo sapiens]
MGCSAKARWAAGALGVAGLLCAVLGAVMIVMVPSLIKQQVLKNVRIDPSSLSFNMWKEIPIPFYLSVYFFDVMNPSEILKGEKPQVRERGPYVYREFRHKSNITFNNNDTVSFLEYRTFQFQPSKSHGSESDYIVMPNILVLGAAVMMENKPMTLKLIMTLAFTTLGERAFMNRTVGEIMWGYKDPLVNLINKYFPGMFPFKDKFGLFAELNNSDSGLFTVFTGVQNISRIHLVDKWNGLSKVTGIPMNCSVKLQLSLYMKSVAGIGQTGKIEPVVLPLLWFAESGAMEGETLHTFYTQLVLMPKVMHYAQYVLLALGCVLLLVPVICQIRSQEKCYLFWSSSKKGSKDKEAIQAYSESLMTSAPKGSVLQEAKL